MNADGRGKRALTHKITETFMSWSPDGRKIAFFDASISVVNADGSGRERAAEPHAHADSERRLGGHLGALVKGAD